MAQRYLHKWKPGACQESMQLSPLPRRFISLLDPVTSAAVIPSRERSRQLKVDGHHGQKRVVIMNFKHVENKSWHLTVHAHNVFFWFSTERVLTVNNDRWSSDRVGGRIWCLVPRSCWLIPWTFNTYDLIRPKWQIVPPNILQVCLMLRCTNLFCSVCDVLPQAHGDLLNQAH